MLFEGNTESDDDAPHFDAQEEELEVLSDSSDCNHQGNGIPYKFYNHDGCKKNDSCEYSHAPDLNSIRDKLGKNVCLYSLLRSCKFGPEKCVYSHSQDNLPEHWRNGVLEPLMAFGPRTAAQMAKKVVLSRRHCFVGIDSSPEGASNTKHHKAKKGKKGKKPRNAYRHPLLFDSDDSDYEFRIMHNGFGEGDVEELMMQGVNPWDDDAADVLAALSMY
ncbi:hypothetical protein HGRIS_006159 [Hohenbuehelia grisea]